MKNFSYDLIKSPIITEKTTILSESGKYVFAVNKNATKNSIANAIASIFDVKVQKVNIVNIPGKIKRFRGKIGKRQDTKKAIVTLEGDATIDFTGGIK